MWRREVADLGTRTAAGKETEKTDVSAHSTGCRLGTRHQAQHWCRLGTRHQAPGTALARGTGF